MMKEESKSNKRVVIQQLIQEIKTSEINHNNYRNLYNRVINMVEVIDGLIDNNLEKVEKSKQSYKEIINQKVVKEAINDNRPPPLVAWELLLEIVKLRDEIINWLTFRQELLFISFKKFYEAFASHEGHDIESEVMKRYNERFKEEMQHNKEIVEQLLEVFKEQNQYQLDAIKQKMFLDIDNIRRVVYEQSKEIYGLKGRLDELIKVLNINAKVTEPILDQNLNTLYPTIKGSKHKVPSDLDDVSFVTSLDQEELKENSKAIADLSTDIDTDDSDDSEEDDDDINAITSKNIKEMARSKVKRSATTKSIKRHK